MGKEEFTAAMLVDWMEVCRQKAEEAARQGRVREMCAWMNTQRRLAEKAKKRGVLCLDAL